MRGSGYRMRMFPRFISRRLRWAWLAAIAGAIWTNRRDARRWARFVRRTFEERVDFDFGRFMLEARVRAALSFDPVLRRSAAIDDVVVNDGRVSLLTTAATWPDVERHLGNLRRVKGVTDVECTPLVEVDEIIIVEPAAALS